MRANPNRAGFQWFLEIALCLLMGCSAPTATRTRTGAVGGSELTAVYSRASKGYVRPQNPDGSFEPETYVLKNGGNFGGPRYDLTQDKLSFEDVSRVIAKALATQNYVPSEDPATTDLVILVYWGTTIVPDDVNPINQRTSGALMEQADTINVNSGPEGRAGQVAGDIAEKERLLTQAADSAHSEANIDAFWNARSANILGYTDEILRTSPHDDAKMNTLKSEVEQDRYYVVLLAYDYQAARELHVQPKLLWETRFSIPELHNDFGKAFPMMASIAARYFGQDSHGLIHYNLREGHVEVGELKVLGVESGKNAPPDVREQGSSKAPN
jgi:hypothetical protein